MQYAIITYYNSGRTVLPINHIAYLNLQVFADTKSCFVINSAKYTKKIGDLQDT